MFATPTDPFAAVAVIPAVADSAAAAREAVDALLWRRDVRNAAAEVAAASIQRGARDSAVIDGADVVTVEDSPMGRVLDAALRVTAGVPTQVDVFATAPMQAWAHLHALAAHGFLSDDQLGRPRAGETADDPLNLGALPSAVAATDRLALLAHLLTSPTQAPALVVAALSHGEVAVLRPFAWGSGLLARATTRLVMAARGVDPSCFSIPEQGMVELGRASYVRALRAYASGSRDGVAEWCVWHATAVAAGATL